MCPAPTSPPPTIDYEVLLLSRMREGWLRTGDTRQAIDYGVARTAGVITGAAIIMTAVFLAFASSGIATCASWASGSPSRSCSTRPSCGS